MKSITITLLALLAIILPSASAATTKVDHVVYIGLDGWAANTYADSDMPFVKSLADKGAITLEKRSVLPSASAINWASMFMGVGPEVHGYLHWGTQSPEMPLPTGADSIHGFFPTVFQVARTQRPDADIAAFYEWDGVKYTLDTLAMTHHEQADLDHITALAADYIRKNKPMITVVAYDRPDHPGHDNGWGSPEYHDMMHRMDSEIAAIYQAIEDAGMTENTVVIISSDHGGKEYGHGGATLEEMLSPLIMTGPGIVPGTVITDMVISPDIAVTIADRLGLEPSPFWRGRPILAD